MDESSKTLSEKQIDELVKKSQEGHSDSFGELYDFFVAQIYRYFYYRANKDDVEDLTGMLFVKVWEKIKKYKKRKAPFRAWVFRIAHNLLVDYYRTRKEVSQLDEDFGDSRSDVSPVYVTESSLNSVTLRVAISKLKKNYQEIIILRFVNEFDTKEVAKALKMREGSIRVLQFRALAALRKVLGEMGIEGNL